MNSLKFLNNSSTTKLHQLSSELLTRENVDTTWLSIYKNLENPDPVLKKANLDIEIYDEIKRDPQVFACKESRQAGVLSMNWTIEQGEAPLSTKKVIEHIFNNLPMQGIINEILNSRFYGYEVQEIIWEVSDSIIFPSRIQEKPHEWFSFDKDGNLLRRTKDFNNWIIAEQLKFLLTTSNATYKNPFGEALFSLCFWPVTFKKGGLKNWAIFTERYGMPHTIGKVPRSLEHQKRIELLRTLQKMVSDACAVFPDDASIQLLDCIKGENSTEAFERYALYHDRQISKAILGHSAAADSTPGQLGSGNDNLNIRTDLITQDALLVEQAANQLIMCICSINKSLGSIYPKFKLYKKKNIDKSIAERDLIIAKTQNIRFSKSYLKKTHGYSDEDIIVNENGFK